MTTIRRHRQEGRQSHHHVKIGDLGGRRIRTVTQVGQHAEGDKINNTLVFDKP
jgi:hypothetical protein